MITDIARDGSWYVTGALSTSLGSSRVETVCSFFTHITASSFHVRLTLTLTRSYIALLFIIHNTSWVTVTGNTTRDRVAVKSISFFLAHITVPPESVTLTNTLPAELLASSAVLWVGAIHRAATAMAAAVRSHVFLVFGVESSLALITFSSDNIRPAFTFPSDKVTSRRLGAIRVTGTVRATVQIAAIKIVISVLAFVTFTT